jgi:hypothetical protein
MRLREHGEFNAAFFFCFFAILLVCKRSGKILDFTTSMIS